MSSKDKLATVLRKFYSEARALHQKQQQQQQQQQQQKTKTKTKKHVDGMMKELLNSIIPKYPVWSVSHAFQ